MTLRTVSHNRYETQFRIIKGETIDTDSTDPCPLCGGADTARYTEDRFRPYLICRNCSLVFVPERYHVSAVEEKDRYDLHRNDPEDPAYRKFLSRLFIPLREYLPEGAEGLDFGCGPGPALAAMFRESGYRIDTYDKYYDPDNGIFGKDYDFITATEVLEHLHHPGFELERLLKRLKTGGILGIMTKLVRNRMAFERWHYKNDATHVCFFSKTTFEWLGDAWRTRIEFIGNDVILIHKEEEFAIGPPF